MVRKESSPLEDHNQVFPFVAFPNPATRWATRWEQSHSKDGFNRLHHYHGGTLSDLECFLKFMLVEQLPLARSEVSSTIYSYEAKSRETHILNSI